MVESTADGVNVGIGSVEHPMEEGHYIEWIEVIAGRGGHRCFLEPGDKPEANFRLAVTNKIVVRAFCNKHDL